MSKPVATKDQIKAFYKGIESIPRRNCGGCLFFCYTFYLWLEKNGYDDSSYSIIQYCSPWDGDTIPQNEAFISGKNKQAASANHFTWMYNGKQYDADGPFTRGNPPSDWHHHQFDELMKKHLVEKFCINALHNGEWNEEFKRANAMKVVKEKLGITIPKTIGINIDNDTGRVVD